MKLGELLKQYRSEHDLSLRDFAKISGISNSYLSMLETGRHPRSGRPIVPTITKLNQIAQAMGIRIDDLVALLDDMPVRIDGDAGDVPELILTSTEKELIYAFRKMSTAERAIILRSVGIENTKGV